MYMYNIFACSHFHAFYRSILTYASVCTHFTIPLFFNHFDLSSLLPFSTTLCVLPLCASGFSQIHHFPLDYFTSTLSCMSPLNVTKSYIVEKYHIENTSTILLLLTQCFFFCLFVCFVLLCYLQRTGILKVFPVEISRGVRFNIARVRLNFSFHVLDTI